MRINLTVANDHAWQTTASANNLNNVRDALLVYRSQLQLHWRGEEMQHINHAINDILARLATVASELNAIGANIVPAAQEVRRQEDLADARTALAREDNNVANLRRTFDNAQLQHNRNPNQSTQAALNTARNNLNNAIRIRNNAADKVRTLTR